MSARAVMTQRATIERATAVDDEYTPTAGGGAWAAAPGSPVPCRFWQTAEREVVGEKAAVISDARLMIPRTADVRTSDRVNGIVDRRGNTVRAGVMMIEAVIPRRDHQELALTAATS